MKYSYTKCRFMSCWIVSPLFLGFISRHRFQSRSTLNRSVKKCNLISFAYPLLVVDPTQIHCICVVKWCSETQE